LIPLIVLADSLPDLLNILACRSFPAFGLPLIIDQVRLSCKRLEKAAVACRPESIVTIF
jgi:hypothetical protein